MRRASSPDLVIEAETLVHRPPEVVFAWLADVQDHAVYPGSPVAAMPKTPSGPTAVGTRWDEVVRLGPVRMTLVSVVTAIEAGRRLEMRFRGPFQDGDLRYTFHPEDGATRLRQRMTLRIRYAPRPIARRMAARFETRVRTRLEGVRAAIEAGPVE